MHYYLRQHNLVARDASPRSSCHTPGSFWSAGTCVRAPPGPACSRTVGICSSVARAAPAPDWCTPGVFVSVVTVPGLISGIVIGQCVARQHLAPVNASKHKNIPYGQSSAKLSVIQSLRSIRSLGLLGSFGSIGSIGSFNMATDLTDTFWSTGLLCRQISVAVENIIIVWLTCCSRGGRTRRSWWRARRTRRRGRTGTRPRRAWSSTPRRSSPAPATPAAVILQLHLHLHLATPLHLSYLGVGQTSHSHSRVGLGSENKDGFNLKWCHIRNLFFGGELM